jgi:hypothetical protein
VRACACSTRVSMRQSTHATVGVVRALCVGCTSVPETCAHVHTDTRARARAYVRTHARTRARMHGAQYPIEMVRGDAMHIVAMSLQTCSVHDAVRPFGGNVIGDPSAGMPLCPLERVMCKRACTLKNANAQARTHNHAWARTCTLPLVLSACSPRFSMSQLCTRQRR